MDSILGDVMKDKDVHLKYESESSTGNALLGLGQAQSEALLKAFKTIDKDNSGYITEDEIEKCLKDYGFEHQAEEIVQIIRECDQNSDGKISYDEFAHMMNMGGKGTNKADEGIARRKSVSKQPV